MLSNKIKRALRKTGNDEITYEVMHKDGMTDDEILRYIENWSIVYEVDDLIENLDYYKINLPIDKENQEAFKDFLKNAESGSSFFGEDSVIEYKGERYYICYAC